MLLERDLIQSVGFRNVREGDRVTGFQFRVRMPSYRGMAASLIDGIAVRVDDLVDVGADVPLWTFAGRTYTLAELWDGDGVRWPLEEAAIVTVPLDGGLPDGVHEVSIELRLRMSYIPEEHQPSTYRETRHITLSPEAAGGPFKYGVSLYSFMTDYGTVLDLETALAAVADVGATGVEILGEGHIAGYPEPTTEWIDRWFALLEQYALEPTNYGSWIDTRLHSSGPNARALSAAEGAGMLQRDLRLAKRLGFRFVRPKIGVVSGDLVPDPIWTESVERSLDLAARARRRDLPRDPLADARSSTRWSTATSSSSSAPARSTSACCSTPGSSRTARSRCARASCPGQRPAFLDGIGVDPADIADIAKYVVFIQAKFHDIDERLEDQQIPWEPVLQALKDAGYTGYLSSEYEGERIPWRSIEQVRRQHSLIRRIADGLD